ncbi:hypothetical protein ACJJIQ_05190 [Microbulbifer sp. ANSA003]|uniref:hypothetical protein n=1 Tax=Microbulbifer sp. ANSA003 TaxID=3243360 RepID=UPI0040422A3A
MMMVVRGDCRGGTQPSRHSSIAAMAVNVVDEAAGLVSDCIGEVANRLAVHSSIAAMAIPSG